MQLLVTNLTSSPVNVGDFYTTIAANGTLTVDRPASAVSGLKSLQALIAAGTVSVAFTPTADEIASGLLAPPNTVTADDMASVDLATVASGVFQIRQAITAGGAAAVAIYAANALPFKFRILDACMYVSTAAGASTCDLQREAAADLIGMQFDTAATGKKEAVAATASALMTPGATKGLFLVRSTNAVAGEVVLTCRREN